MTRLDFERQPTLTETARPPRTAERSCLLFVVPPHALMNTKSEEFGESAAIDRVTN